MIKKTKSKEEREAYAQKLKNQISSYDEQVKNMIDWIENPKSDKEVKQFLDDISKLSANKKYSSRNLLLLQVQAKMRDYHNVDYVAPFKKWSDLEGTNGEKVMINKGSKAYDLLVPMVKKDYMSYEEARKSFNNFTSIINMAPQEKEKQFKEMFRKDPKSDKYIYECVYFGLGKVFDLRDTNAVEIGAIDFIRQVEKNDISEEEYNSFVTLVAKEYNIEISHQDLGLKLGGYYQPSNHSITLNNNEYYGNANKLSILFHELGHSLMHNENNPMRELDKGIIEGQAESFANIMLHRLNLSTENLDTKNFRYIKTWLEHTNDSDKPNQIYNDFFKFFDKVLVEVNNCCDKLNITNLKFNYSKKDDETSEVSEVQSTRKVFKKR